MNVLRQVLSAIKKRSEPVADDDLMKCSTVLMTAIRKFLPLVFATRVKAGWFDKFDEIWESNKQEKTVNSAKSEVFFRNYF